MFFFFFLVLVSVCACFFSSVWRFDLIYSLIYLFFYHLKLNFVSYNQNDSKIGLCQHYTG